MRYTITAIAKVQIQYLLTHHLETTAQDIEGTLIYDAGRSPNLWDLFGNQQEIKVSKFEETITNRIILNHSEKMLALIADTTRRLTTKCNK